MTKLPNGFYSYSDSYLKSMKKQDLINYIRTIEKNWENQLITNEIQYDNCKRLLAEERNKAIDEFTERLKENSIRGAFEYKPNKKEPWHKVRAFCRVVGMRKIDEIAEEMRGAE